jgi:hypothetical protein
LTRHGNGDARAPLTDIALDVLERIEPGDLANEFIRAAIIATIGQTAWIQNANGDFKATPGLRLRAVHAYLLQESDMYRPGLYVLEPRFMRKPPLVHHFAHLVESGALDRKADRDKIEQFVRWLATWPADKKPRRRRAHPPGQVAVPPRPRPAGRLPEPERCIRADCGFS